MTSSLKSSAVAILLIWILLSGQSPLITRHFSIPSGSFPNSQDERRQGGFLIADDDFADQKISARDLKDSQTQRTTAKPQREKLMPQASGIQLRADNINPPKGKGVQFEASNITGIRPGSFRFYFGDGVDSGWIPNPRASHVFNIPGDYKAFVSAREASNTIAVATPTIESSALAIHVRDIRMTLRTFSPSPIIAGREAQFEIRTEPYDSDMQYLFAFGDGQQTGWINKPTIGHRYATAGTYNTIGMIGFDRKTAVARDLVAVEVSAAPAPQTVRLEASPTSVQPGQPVTFSTFLDPEIIEATYEYDFGDGSPFLRTRQRQLEHVYQSPGEFRARVSISEGDLNIGESEAVMITVMQSPEPPSLKQAVILRASPLDTVPGREVRFDGLVKPGGAEASYRFDFGDGTRSEGRNSRDVTHAYAKPGRYTAVLFVTMQGGEFSSNEVVIWVREERFDIHIIASLSHAEPRTPIEFRGDVRPPGEDVEYQFVFGDDSTTDWSRMSVVRHAYAKDGIYRAYLRGRRGVANILQSDILEITIESPPSIPWGGIVAGLLVLACAGVLITKSVRTKKMVRHFHSTLRASPRADSANQHVEPEKPNQINHEIRLRAVADQGKQELDSAVDIVIEEQKED